MEQNPPPPVPPLFPSSASVGAGLPLNKWLVLKPGQEGGGNKRLVLKPGQEGGGNKRLALRPGQEGREGRGRGPG